MIRTQKLLFKKQYNSHFELFPQMNVVIANKNNSLTNIVSFHPNKGLGKFALGKQWKAWL